MSQRFITYPCCLWFSWSLIVCVVIYLYYCHKCYSWLGKKIELRKRSYVPFPWAKKPSLVKGTVFPGRQVGGGRCHLLPKKVPIKCLLFFVHCELEPVLEKFTNTFYRVFWEEPGQQWQYVVRAGCPDGDSHPRLPCTGAAPALG